jgi:hypothetical protein
VTPDGGNPLLSAGQIEGLVSSFAGMPIESRGVRRESAAALFVADELTVFVASAPIGREGATIVKNALVSSMVPPAGGDRRLVGFLSEAAARRRSRAASRHRHGERRHRA